MPSKRTHVELVQKQIADASRDLGKIKETAPYVDTVINPVTSILNPNENIIWKESYF